MFHNGLRAAAFVALAVSVAGAAAAEDKLSKSDKNWMEKEVGPIITASEMATFQQINKDDRKLFKDLFWMRRDFNPMSPENEFEKDYDTRVKAADQNFKGRGGKGSESDMGQIFILLGAPSRQEKGTAGPAGQTPSQAPSGADPDASPSSGEQPGGQSAFGAPGGNESSMMSWIYGPRPELGIPDGLTVPFRAQGGFGYRLVSSPDLEKQLDRVKGRLITNPSVNYVMDESGRLRKPDTRFDPNSPAKLALKALQETKQTSDAIAFDVRPAFFRSSAGQIYIPIDFVVESGLTGKDATVFGAVENADSYTVYQFEEKAEVEKTGDVQAWEMPLQLQPGSYKLYVGVMDGAGAVTGTKIVDLTVPDFDAGDLTLSSVLMFSEGNKVNEAMGAPGRAFLLGGYHFVPKREMVYTQKDQLSGVFNAYNFGVDGDKPNLTVQVTFFKGDERRGATKEEAFMLQTAEMALTIFDIPLNLPNFKDPGDYKVEIKVVDHVKDKTITKEIPFVIKGE
jgi:GWxTD domain-containing protein